MQIYARKPHDLLIVVHRYAFNYDFLEINHLADKIIVRLSPVMLMATLYLPALLSVFYDVIDQSISDFEHFYIIGLISPHNL